MTNTDKETKEDIPVWSYKKDQWTKLPNHINHLPLITQHSHLTYFLVRLLWFQILKLFFKFYLKVTVKGGDFTSLISKYPKLFIISNHSSHLDAISIISSIPFLQWRHLYTTAARDYFFSNTSISLFSKYCMKAVPIERSYRIRQSLKLCINLIEKLDKIWLVMFPEGTRSQTGNIQPFKRGLAMLAQKTKTPTLFLFVQGAFKIWPKGSKFPPPGGKITIHIGPVQSPTSSEEFYKKYKQWVSTLPLS